MDEGTRPHTNRSGWVLTVVMLLGDLLAVALAYGLSFSFRRLVPLLPPLEHGPDLYLQAWPLLLLWPLGFFIQGLYPGWWHTASEEVRRIVWGCTLAGLLVMSATFITRTGPQYSRPIIVGGWLLSLVIVPCLRLPLKRGLARIGVVGPPVVVLGGGPHSADLPGWDPTPQTAPV